MPIHSLPPGLSASSAQLRENQIALAGLQVDLQQTGDGTASVQKPPYNLIPAVLLTRGNLSQLGPSAAEFYHGETPADGVSTSVTHSQE